MPSVGMFSKYSWPRFLEIILVNDMQIIAFVLHLYYLRKWRGLGAVGGFIREGRLFDTMAWWALNRGRALIRACVLIRGNAICTIWEKRAEELFWATSLMIPFFKSWWSTNLLKRVQFGFLAFQNNIVEDCFLHLLEKWKENSLSVKICSFVSWSRHSGSS